MPAGPLACDDELRRAAGHEAPARAIDPHRGLPIPESWQVWPSQGIPQAPSDGRRKPNCTLVYRSRFTNREVHHMRVLRIILCSLVLATLAGCVFYGGHGDWHHHYWGW